MERIVGGLGLVAVRWIFEIPYFSVMFHDPMMRV